MKEQEQIEISGAKTSSKAIASLLSDLFPSSTNGDHGDDDDDPVENIICASAALKRLSLVNFYKHAQVVPLAGRRAHVIVEEPALRWTLGLHTAATSAGRRLSASITASLRNLFGKLVTLDSRIGVGGSGSGSDNPEVVGEMSLSQVLFPNGGRNRLVEWNRAKRTENSAISDALGEPTVGSVGVRIATEDRSAFSDVKRKVYSVFASVRSGVLGSFSTELSKDSVSVGPDAVPALAIASSRRLLETPRLKFFHTMGFDTFQTTTTTTKTEPNKGIAATISNEVCVELPNCISSSSSPFFCSGAEYLRQIAAIESRIPLGFGSIFQIVAKTGLLFGLRSLEPTQIAAGLESFSIGSSLVRCMQVRPNNVRQEQQQHYKLPICSFASISATLSAPIPYVPPIKASGGRRAWFHAFIDAGGISQSANPQTLINSSLKKPRVSSGIGISLPIGPSGRIELNFSIPIAYHPQDTPSRFDFGSSPSYMF